MEFKKVFINPEGLFEALDVAAAEVGPAVGGFDPNPNLDPEVDLGPSAPPEHADLSAAELEALGPGQPPIIAGGNMHYTNVLDELWIEFDDPEERTAARMLALLEEVGDEALRIHHLSQDMWEGTSLTKVPQAVRDQFNKEFLAYARRVRGYQDRLTGLAPGSTDTDEVYLGLIKRRPATGPVPDAIMHLYFANQLGILNDHAHSMGQGFVGRVMTALDATTERIEEAAELIEKGGQAAKERTDAFWERVRELRWWIAGGTVVTIGTSVGLAVGLSRLGSSRRGPPT